MAPQRPLLLAQRGSWVNSLLCTDDTHAVSSDATRADLRVPHCFGSLVAFSSGCQPGSYESAPFFAWSVLGSPPFCTVHHCTGQVATDPQSPKGGSQRACPLGVPTPRLLGDSQRWRCLSSRTLLWQLGSGLFGMPAREI